MDSDFNNIREVWLSGSSDPDYNMMARKVKIKARNLVALNVLRNIVFILMIVFLYRIRQLFNLFSPTTTVGFVLIYICILFILPVYWYNIIARGHQLTTKVFVFTLTRYLKRLCFLYSYFLPVFGIVLTLAINLILYEIVFEKAISIRFVVHLSATILLLGVIFIGRKIHLRRLNKEIAIYEHFNFCLKE